MLHERQQRRETRSVKQAFSNRLSSFSSHFNVKTQILRHLGRSRIQRFDLCPPALFPLMSVIITPQHGEKNTQSQNINIIKPKHYETLSQKGWYIFKNVMEIKLWFIYLVRRVYRELICMLSHIQYFLLKEHQDFESEILPTNLLLIWKFTDRTFHL